MDSRSLVAVGKLGGVRSWDVEQGGFELGSSSFMHRVVIVDLKMLS